MQFKRLEDDSVESVDGRIILHSVARFINEIANGDVCFICGGAKPGTKEFQPRACNPRLGARSERETCDGLLLLKPKIVFEHPGETLKFNMGVPRTPGSVVNLGRHKRACSVCAHKQREEVESAFISWRSPAAIAEEYGLSDRASVYRHAHALGLFQKRQRNVRMALERIIEKAGEVDVTASAVVAAVQAYAKINSAGEWIDRTENVSLNDLFDRMSTEELEAYAQSGALPGWFRATARVTQ